MCGALGAVEGVILRDQIRPVAKKWITGWLKHSVDNESSDVPLRVPSSSVLLQEFDLLWGNCRLNNRYSVCIGPGSSYTPIIAAEPPRVSSIRQPPTHIVLLNVSLSVCVRFTPEDVPLKVPDPSVLLQEFDLLWGNCRLDNRYSVCLGQGYFYTPIIVAEPPRVSGIQHLPTHIMPLNVLLSVCVKRFNLVPLDRRRLAHNAHIDDSKALITGSVEPADPYARDRAFAREFFKDRMIFGGRPRQMHPPPRAPAPSLPIRGRLPGGPKNASLWPRGPVPGSNGFESRRNLPRPESRIDEGWNVVSGRSSGALVLAV
ncbi:hypothetical protein FRC07_011286 [Ceratobasidium sp. 392]|nr:hypothetical protein FRC07_011286 [Ceratobasidium sp. 392]